MLKRFLGGAVLLAALCGSGIAPAQADEVYIRNRPFKDAYFLSGTTYVPVDSFLKAVRVPYRLDGSTVVVGRGQSPAVRPRRSQIALLRNGERLDLSGVLRGGKLYVPAKRIAQFVDYGVIYNRDTGIVDVVKSRFISSDDEKAASDVVAAKQADKDLRDAAWQVKVDKARADRQAKKEAAEAARAALEEDDEDFDDEDFEDEDMEDEDMADSDEDSDDDDDDDDDSFEDEEPTTVAADSDDDEDGENEPPPVAELVVLNTQALPNYYTGEVVFTAVFQNQRYASAGDVTASYIGKGPDGKTWVRKTFRRGPLKPDERWEIRHEYRHHLRASMPREGQATSTGTGRFELKVTPNFKTVPQ